jgi:hypothetical protein
MKKSTTKYNGKNIETVNIAPTWRWAMSVYIRVIAEHGYDDKSKDAREELYRLADYVDSLTAQSKQS